MKLKSYLQNTVGRLSQKSKEFIKYGLIALAIGLYFDKKLIERFMQTLSPESRNRLFDLLTKHNLECSGQVRLFSK